MLVKQLASSSLEKGGEVWVAPQICRCETSVSKAQSMGLTRISHATSKSVT
jgi:hypothetical protein